MTATFSLLDIDVDELFEQHGVADIDHIHKKLQTDVEHKKEELRTMVGERYRDLLQAADTIGAMRTTGTAVVANVDAVTGTCRRLNEQQLIGFRRTGVHTPIHQPAGEAPAPAVVAQPPPTAAERAVHQFHALGVQIKLLTALPELIWSRLDAEDYFVATQLFALSRHISTGLQLDVHRPLMQHFPVARQLWAQLSPFYQTIRRSCLAALSRRELSTGTAAKCLASLLLLEQGTTIDRLLGVLIELRGRTFRDVLLDEADGRRIQEKVLSSLDVLLATVRLVHECFVDGAVRTEVLQLHGPDARPTIDLMAGTFDATFAQRLPDIIATYRPRVQLTELQPESVRSATAGWLHYTAVDCKRHIQSVIDGIASVQTIQRIREQSLAITKPPNWALMLDALQLPADWDLYRCYFQPLINERVQKIIQQSWQSIIRSTLADVERLTQLTDRTYAEPKNADKWRPNGAAVPQSLKQALSADRRQHPMLLAERGYAPPIVAVCSALDAQLQSIYDDLTLYLGEPDAMHGDQADAEHALIVAYLQATSREAVSELIDAIKSIGGHRSKSTSVALATLLPAILELCPNLKKCLQQGGINRSVADGAPATSDWATVTGLLAAESFGFWSEWIGAFVGEQAARLPASVAIDYQHMAGDQLLWERISVEETDEEERPVESTIRVPSHVSVGLQLFWHQVSTQLQVQLVPYTLPPRVMAALVAALTEHVRTVYAARAAQPFVQASQTASLQCYFDVRFVQLVFVARSDGGAKIADEWAELVAAFKGNVDPFDFELFHRYVGANVKKAVLRMQHKLGVLIANVDQLAGVLAAGQPPAATAQDKEPNVLTLSTAKNETAGYFSLLPVMSVSSHAQHVTGGQTTKALPGIESANPKPKRSKAQSTAVTSATPTTVAQPNASAASGARADGNNLANVKSGAAAFFGAMSKDWFQ